MQRSLILTISILFGSSQIIAQENGEIDEFGFIDIKTDSMNVPFLLMAFMSEITL